MPSRTARRTPAPVRVIPYTAGPVPPRPRTAGALALRLDQAPARGRPRPGRPPAPGRSSSRSPSPGGRPAPGGSPSPLGQARPRGGNRAVPPGGPVLRAVGSPERDEDLGAVVAATLRLVTEVLAGTRPVRQLARRATPQVCDGLAAFAVPAGGPVRPPRVLTSWLQEPAPGTAEAGAVVALSGRVQALALRLERHRGRWRCTALETTAPAS